MHDEVRNDAWLVLSHADRGPDIFICRHENRYTYNLAFRGVLNVQYLCMTFEYTCMDCVL